MPTHTRRSEEMERFQQLSTPLPMGLAALPAAQITPRDLVLEPSAGTGLLSILAEIADGSLMLNELAATHADLLRRLFPGRPVTAFDAAQIDDHLDTNLHPIVILMNPPFSALAIRLCPRPNLRSRYPHLRWVVLAGSGYSRSPLSYATLRQPPLKSYGTVFQWKVYARDIGRAHIWTYYIESVNGAV